MIETTPETVLSPAAVALNRFGLGARPDEAAPDDAKAWLYGQFARYRPDLPGFDALPDAGRTVADYLVEVRRLQSGAPTPEAMQAMRKDYREGLQTIYRGGVAARTNACLTAPAPLIERLVHFWSNHFAVSIEKPQVAGFAPAFEAEAIRPHVLGRFEDMLLAVERHAAMLLYLDQAVSVGPNSPMARRVTNRNPERSPGLNENLARENLELHTLGVRTGYTQEDVTELARALTGWTVAGMARGGRMAALSEGVAGAFLFVPALHEPGARTVLSERYPAGGEDQAEAILRRLAVRPETARHLATKLARHFAGDTPPASLVERLTAAYQRSGGDLPTVYRGLIDSPEAWTPRAVKFKTPWEWTVSAMRGLGYRSLERAQLAQALAQLGQPTWRPGSPAGWDDTAAAWVGPDALVRRVELAQRLAAPATSRLDPRTLPSRLLPGVDVADLTAEIARAESFQTGLALLIVSPAFQRR